MSGRTLLNALTQEEIVRALRNGATIKEAAGAAGVGWRTIYDWLQRGERYERALEMNVTPDDADQPFYEFRQEAEKARQAARVEAVRVWRLAIAGVLRRDKEGKPILDEFGNPIYERWPDWKAAMAWLERVDPATWGRRWAPDSPAPSDSDEPEEALDALVARAEEIVRDHAENLRRVENDERERG